MRLIATWVGASAVLVTLSGCGTYVPEKNPLQPDMRLTENGKIGPSREGLNEANLVGNIRCEVQNAIYEANKLNTMPYLVTTWGTQITLKLTWDEMSNLSPNVSIIDPLIAMQSFSMNVSASATAHSTRLETVTFLWENRALLAAAKVEGKEDCSVREKGILIDSDLRIADFIYDKATLAGSQLVTTVALSNPVYSTFQEDLTFVGSYGGNITPVWKLTRVSSNSTGTLLGATRTNTGDILITLGALAKDAHGNLLPSLASDPAAQHAAGLIGGAVGSQVKSQTP